MQSKNLKIYFDKKSLLPIIVFIIGLFTIFEFSVGDYSAGFFSMLLGLIVYAVNNIFISKTNAETKFNQYLDDLSEFAAFGLPPIIFAVMFYSSENSFLIMLVVFFFSTATILSMARNWTISAKNSVGWPLPFNALFLPVIYYSYLFYLNEAGSSVFLFYFIIAGILCSSNYNFLGNLDPKLRHEDEIPLDYYIKDIKSKSPEKKHSMKQQIENFYNPQKENSEDDLWNEEIYMEEDSDDEEFYIDENEDFEIEFENEDKKPQKKSDNKYIKNGENEIFPSETELRDTLDPPKRKLGFFGKLLWKLKRGEKPFFENKEFPSEDELEETLNQDNNQQKSQDKKDSVKESKEDEEFEIDFDSEDDDMLDRKWT